MAAVFVYLAVHENQAKKNAPSVTGDTSKLSFSSYIVRVGGLTSTNTDARVLEVSLFSPSNSGKYAAPFYYLWTPRLEGCLAVLTLCKKRPGERSKLDVIFLASMRDNFHTNSDP